MKEITIKLNTEEMKRRQGIPTTSAENLIFYINGLIYTLSIHNKNYTKEQLRIIDTLKDIFECIEIKQK